jgi:hypothetical protein
VEEVQNVWCKHDVVHILSSDNNQLLLYNTYAESNADILRESFKRQSIDPFTDEPVNMPIIWFIYNRSLYKAISLAEEEEDENKNMIWYDFHKQLPPAHKVPKDCQIILYDPVSKIISNVLSNKLAPDTWGYSFIPHHARINMGNHLFAIYSPVISPISYQEMINELHTFDRALRAFIIQFVLKPPKPFQKSSIFERKLLYSILEFICIPNVNRESLDITFNEGKPRVTWAPDQLKYV